jgi:hypothetical protein
MRERWFFAQGAQRRGPFSLAAIVTAVRGEPDPRAVLVWRKGLRDWTLAEVIPEVARQLARASSPDDTLPLGAAVAGLQPAPTPARTPALVRLRVGFAVIAAVAGIAAVVVQLHSSEPRATPPGTDAKGPVASVIPAPPAAPAPARTTPSPVPAGARPTPAVRAGATPPAHGAPALADDEADLPGAELRKLRGVAAWSGDTLKLTVYNATAWRLTELHVRIERFSGEDFVADEHLITLVPPSQRVDVGVADLLARVAPDRKKPGLNSLDTGVFEARAGTAPEGFRWEFESARGYPPLR